MALPALLLFSARVVSNLGTLVIAGGDVNSPLEFIRFEDDWVTGVVDIGIMGIISDVFCVGGGAWSVDRWLSERFATR